ncbi:hypothetical protein L914_15414, partial [Phytophthora nicotianae]
TEVSDLTPPLSWLDTRKTLELHVRRFQRVRVLLKSYGQELCVRIAEQHQAGLLGIHVSFRSSKMGRQVLLPLRVVNHLVAVIALDVWMLLYTFLGWDNLSEMLPNLMLAHIS